MATGGSDFQNDKSQFKMKLTAADYGPLNVVGDGHITNFRGGTYYVTTPKTSFMKLYRLYGGIAGEDGQYWTVDERRGNEGYRHDMAVERNWGNTLQKDSEILVPKGTLLYEGYAASQRQYLGGGWQVFIPRNVLQPILEVNRIIKSGVVNPLDMERRLKPYLQKIDEVQSTTVKRWTEERIKRIEESTENIISQWRRSGNMPADLQRIMDGQKETTSQGGGNPTNKTYTVCQQRLQRLDGSSVNLTLSVRKEFVRSETRTYQVGKTIVTEITNYYNLIKEWK